MHNSIRITFVGSDARDLRPYLPSGCHLLITSRRDDSQWRGLARTLTLGVVCGSGSNRFLGTEIGD